MTISPGVFPPYFTEVGVAGVEGRDSEPWLIVEAVLILESHSSLFKSSNELISLGGDCGIESRPTWWYVDSRVIFIDLRCSTCVLSG